MEGGGRFCSFRWDDKQSFALSELESESGKKTGGWGGGGVCGMDEDGGRFLS